MGYVAAGYAVVAATLVGYAAFVLRRESASGRSHRPDR
jgi:hypothetical protein